MQPLPHLSDPILPHAAGMSSRARDSAAEFSAEGHSSGLTRRDWDVKRLPILTDAAWRSSPRRACTSPTLKCTRMTSLRARGPRVQREPRAVVRAVLALRGRNACTARDRRSSGFGARRVCATHSTRLDHRAGSRAATGERGGGGKPATAVDRNAWGRSHGEALGQRPPILVARLVGSTRDA